LCAKISEIKKNEDESIKYFLIRFMHLCYRFPFDDRFPSTNDFILCLVSLTIETYEPMDEKYKSCLNVPLHVDLDSCKNFENAKGLVGIHMFGYFFTMGEYRSERFILQKKYMYPPTTPFPPLLPCDETKTSCIVNSSSHFFVAGQEGFFLLIIGHFGSH